MTVLDELPRLLRDVDEAVRGAVVSIGRHGRGTGFVVAHGKVLTNAHNLRDATTAIGFADGRAVQGSLAGRDVDGDLVVLDCDTGGAVALTWADEAPRPGDVVVAVTAGRHRRRVTWGQVTGTDAAFRGPRGRVIRGALEHTAPSGAGSSGAPVLNGAGRVVGINTHRPEPGFYLARAADAALREAVEAMAAGASSERVRLGVALAPSEVASRLRRSVGLDERPGLLVRGVVEGSPAAAAGIREGDLLTHAGERDLRDPEDLFAVLDDLAVGMQLTLTLVRGTEEVAVTVTF